MNTPHTRKEDDDLVREEQIRIAFGQTGRAVFGGSGISVLLVWILWPVGEHSLLLTWLAFQLLIPTVRGVIYLFYRRRPAGDDPSKWQNLLVGGAFLQGCAWGIVWWLFLPQAGHPEYTMLIGAYMIGLSAASISAYSVSLPAMFAFFLPVLVPGIPRLLLLGGHVEIGFAIALGVYAYIVITAMMPINRGMTDAIRLNFENAREIAERQRVEVLLRELSTTDGLTGVATRRHFDEVLAHELERANRIQTPLALILIDVDWFKLYNDSKGHVAGDTCLKQVAGVVKLTGKRPIDLAARYGGEEFALVLPNTNLEQAQRLAEEMRHAVQALALPHESTRVPDCHVVTISVGAASIMPSQETRAEDLIMAADEALYRAKDNGRNRVEVSG